MSAAKILLPAVVAERPAAPRATGKRIVHCGASRPGAGMVYCRARRHDARALAVTIVGLPAYRRLVAAASRPAGRVRNTA